VALARVRPLIWALLALFVCDLLVLSIHGKKWVAARCAIFAVAFALLPVLVSFCCFFCGWHSVRELAGLAKRANPTNPLQGFVRVVRLAIPMAALAAIATVAMAWWFAAERDPTSVVVRGVFLGLSALAVPHILLHEAADRLGAEPFSRNNDAWRTVAIT
jgi:Brp/Blh family beta-carotene 15,15'-monooxygenase